MYIKVERHVRVGYTFRDVTRESLRAEAIFDGFADWRAGLQCDLFYTCYLVP